MNKEHFWSGNDPTEDDIAMMHKPVNENAWIGNCHRDHDPEVEAEVAQYDKRHERTQQRQQELKEARQNWETVKAILAIIEKMNIKSIASLNPRNFALIDQISRAL